VEHLVAHELVAIPQPVQRAALADDDRVVERAAERPAVLPQEAEVLEEAVGPGRRVLVDERLFGRRPRQDLGADRRMVVVQRVADPELGGRDDLQPAIAVAYADRVLDGDGPPPGSLGGTYGPGQQGT